MLKIIIIIVLLYYVAKNNKKEGMSDMTKTKRSQDILKNTHLFSTNSSMTEAKNKLPWLDPIYYHDAFTVLRNNKNADISDLKTIFS